MVKQSIFLSLFVLTTTTTFFGHAEFEKAPASAIDNLIEDIRWIVPVPTKAELVDRCLKFVDVRIAKQEMIERSKRNISQQEWDAAVQKPKVWPNPEKFPEWMKPSAHAERIKKLMGEFGAQVVQVWNCSSLISVRRWANGYQILTNDEFIASLSDEQLKATLAHMAMQVAVDVEGYSAAWFALGKIADNTACPDSLMKLIEARANIFAALQSPSSAQALINVFKDLEKHIDDPSLKQAVLLSQAVLESLQCLPESEESKSLGVDTDAQKCYRVTVLN